jgi:hypothetical protein
MHTQAQLMTLLGSISKARVYAIPPAVQHLMPGEAAHPAGLTYACTQPAALQVLMQHGAQPNEQMMWTKEPCFKAALDLQHEGLLRALFSRSEERTPAALRRMVELVADLYKEPRGVSKWLTLLSAIGVEGLPSVGGVIHMVPGAAWPEVRLEVA